MLNRRTLVHSAPVSPGITSLKSYKYARALQMPGLVGLYFLGGAYARSPIYDYANNRNDLRSRTANISDGYATLDSGHWFDVPFLPATIAAENGEVSLVAIIRGDATGLSTAQGRGFVSNFPNTVSASITLGISNTSNHRYTAAMRDGSGTLIQAQINLDALSGTRFEMLVGNFSAGAVEIHRRAYDEAGVVGSAGSTLSGAQSASGSSGIVPEGVFPLMIGRALATWTQSCDIIGVAIGNKKLTTAQIDVIHANARALVNEEVPGTPY